MIRRLCIALLCGFALGAAAETATWTDPYVPPHVKRSGPPPAETRGKALQSQVEKKLREQFDAADVGKTGALTREQARAGGFGFIAENFDAIDTARTGLVRFDDLMRYLAK